MDQKSTNYVCRKHVFMWRIFTSEYQFNCFQAVCSNIPNTKLSIPPAILNSDSFRTSIMVSNVLSSVAAGIHDPYQYIYGNNSLDIAFKKLFHSYSLHIFELVDFHRYAVKLDGKWKTSRSKRFTARSNALISINQIRNKSFSRSPFPLSKSVFRLCMALNGLISWRVIKKFWKWLLW